MSEVLLTTWNVVCENHRDKSIQVFCMDHNQPCCSTCITIHHHNCDHVTSLKEAANQFLDSKDFVDLSQRLKDTSAFNQELINEKREIIKRLNDQKTAIEKELQDMVQRTMGNFDRMHSNFSQVYTQKHNLKVQELTNSTKDIENTNKRIENCLNLMDTYRTRSSKNILFLELKKILEREKEQVAELEQTQAEHKGIEHVFRLNEDVKKLITELNTVGQIDTMEKESLTSERYPTPGNSVRMYLPECLMSPKLLSSFSINDKCGVDTNIEGGCFIPDNTLLLPLYNAKRLALFSSNGDLIKQSGDLSGYVKDVCMIDPTTAVVTRYFNDVIDYIDIPTLTVNKTVSIGDHCGGITSSDNTLYVACYDKLLILDKDGNKKKKIKKGCYISGITVVNTGEKKIVYNCFHNNSCHFLRLNNLKEVTVFTHPEFRNPFGVTSDREGSVYTVGCQSGNVFQLSSEGDFIRILLTGLNCPRGIQFDENSDMFFVSYAYPAKVNIYNMIK